MNILVVEPNKRIAGLIKAYFEDKSSDFEVQIAHDAQSAIITADKFMPDLVILELAMREQNGFAFLYEFRSYDDWKDVPLIIHSHLAVEEAMMSKSWKYLGANRYFYKPSTSLEKLYRAAKEILDS